MIKTMNDAAYTDAVLQMAHVALCSARESAKESERDSVILRTLAQVVLGIKHANWPFAVRWYDAGMSSLSQDYVLLPFEREAVRMVAAMLHRARNERAGAAIVFTAECFDAVSHGLFASDRGLMAQAIRQSGGPEDGGGR